MSLEGKNIRTFRAVVSYDGTDFCGFQEQPGQPTIQSALKSALVAVFRGDNALKFAGRTDAGVHARGQTISIELETKLEPQNILLALSHNLPKSIRVVRVDEMGFGFNPKKHAIGKQYIYRIWNALSSNPFCDRFTWHVRRPIDIALMNEAAQHLVGEHDFESFRSSSCVAQHARRYIWKISVSRNESLVAIDVRGNAFCQNMVRIISGTLLEVGVGKIEPTKLKSILEHKNRCLAGITAPAQGLTLERVYYPDSLIDAEIPFEARFPRYPVTSDSWPFNNEQIKIGLS